MSDLRTAAQQALDDLRDLHANHNITYAGTISRLEAALAQQAEPVASRGWLFRRNADGTIGIFAPPPKPGESQRTSDCVGPNNRDLHELLGKLADHMAALAQQAEPVGTRALIEECRAAFAQELAAWDIDPPLHHVKQAHDKCEAWLAAPPQQAEPVAADALTEPKSGDKWRVEWWNESCRMMLPAHAKLDSFVAYKNGTIQFTIKRTAA